MKTLPFRGKTVVGKICLGHGALQGKASKKYLLIKHLNHEKIFQIQQNFGCSFNDKVLVNF